MANDPTRTVNHLFEELVERFGDREAAMANPSDSWRSLLYICGKHPTVHIPANVAYAHDDLTHETEGKVSFNGAPVTSPSAESRQSANGYTPPDGK